VRIKTGPAPGRQQGIKCQPLGQGCNIFKAQLLQEGSFKLKWTCHTHSWSAAVLGNGVRVVGAVGLSYQKVIKGSMNRLTCYAKGNGGCLVAATMCEKIILTRLPAHAWQPCLHLSASQPSAQYV
jgi:hypothetical protein